MDWEFIWRSIKFFFKSIVEWADLHYGFLMVILTAITAIVLILYTTSTWKMSKSTNKSVKVAEKSIRLTKDKEKIDRTLKLIDKFDSGKFFLLQDKLGLTSKLRFILPIEQIVSALVAMTKDPNFRKDIAYFINYFDTVAVFYFEGKIDRKLFKVKLDDKFISFIFNYREEIKKIFEGNKKDVENVLYWQQSFLRLAVEILDEKRKIDSNLKDLFENCYNFYRELLGEDKK